MFCGDFRLRYQDTVGLFIFVVLRKRNISWVGKFVVSGLFFKYVCKLYYFVDICMHGADQILKTTIIGHREN